MKIDSSDFRPRKGKAIEMDRWPTLVPPLFESKAEYEAVLKQHAEGLSGRQQLHYASARCAVLLIRRNGLSAVTGGQYSFHGITSWFTGCDANHQSEHYKHVAHNSYGITLMKRVPTRCGPGLPAALQRDI
jgi:hypothetical protein